VVARDCKSGPRIDQRGQESEQYSLGATVGSSLGEQQSLAFYANVDLLEGQSTWTASPSWGIALADSVGAFIETGYQFGSAQDQTDKAVAGGGLTWMVTPLVQLDVYGARWSDTQQHGLGRRPWGVDLLQASSHQSFAHALLAKAYNTRRKLRP
jgi:hypothetical protein